MVGKGEVKDLKTGKLTGQKIAELSFEYRYTPLDEDGNPTEETSRTEATIYLPVTQDVFDKLPNPSGVKGASIVGTNDLWEQVGPMFRANYRNKSDSHTFDTGFGRVTSAKFGNPERVIIRSGILGFQNYAWAMDVPEAKVTHNDYVKVKGHEDVLKPVR